MNKIVRNVCRPVTLKYDGSFHEYGPNITQLLEKYPIANSIWSVFGEEFITSYKLFSTDKCLVDPWLRPFSDSMLENMVTAEKPEKHIIVPTTVEGITYMCNIYIEELITVRVNCTVCLKKDKCVECNKTMSKLVSFPRTN